MRRIVAGVFALSFGLLSFGKTDAARLSVSQAAADPSASDCIGFQKSDLEKGLLFEASSSCDKKLTCSLSWVLTCESDKGQVTSRKPGSSRFTIDANGSGSETASAETCKQSWRIDDVRWSCQEVK
ncbi:MAG: hypothetical protein R3B13_20965 [Polyangiaceae bacterium]